MNVHYSSCPVCNSREINPLLTVKDHSVSKQDFVIWQCGACTLRFTQDVPDEDSIAPFYKSEDYISHTNTSKGMINRLYQTVRKFTLGQKADWVMQHTKKEGKLLDLGAGVGAFVHTMQQKGWEVTGLEPDADARAQAARAFNVELKDASTLNDLQENYFDAVTLWHVLEHVHQLHDYLDTIKSLLKKDGKLVVAVPNYTSLDGSTYRNAWAAYDVPRHLYHFTPKSIDVLMKRHGFKVVAKKPMLFDAFYISLLSSRYRHGSTRWLGAAWTGLRSNLKALANKNACSSLVYIIEKA